MRNYVEVVAKSDVIPPAVLKEIELANCGVSADGRKTGMNGERGPDPTMACGLNR
jgi:phosphoenolpyruvate-protein kinase (PTS system EI component)